MDGDTLRWSLVSGFVPDVRSFVVVTRRSALVAVASVLLTVTLAQAQGGFDANGQCVGDQNGDGRVTIDEVLVALNNAASGCQFVPMTLQFRGVVGTQPFACGNQYDGLGTTAVTVAPSDFRFYIHNVRLVNTNGAEVPLRLDQDGIWQYQNVALLDFENKMGPCAQEGNTATNTTVRGMVAPGTYTGVRFLLGVPFNLDHINQATAPSPLNLTSLWWGWQDGYRFLKVDLVNPDTFAQTFVHIGSMGCQIGPGSVVSSCSLPNIAAVNLDSFNPATNVIVADLAALLGDSDLNANQPGSPPGCESNPDDMDCVPLFKNLGINFTDGSPSPTSQKFFRVEAANP